MSRTKGGSIPKYIWPWMRMVCRLKSLSLKAPVRTCKEAACLTPGLLAGALLADKAYDTNAIIDAATGQGMQIVIPSKKCIHQRSYNKEIYEMRNLIENAFLDFKRWRGIATRYAKNAAHSRLDTLTFIAYSLITNFQINGGFNNLFVSGICQKKRAVSKQLELFKVKSLSWIVNHLIFWL